MEQEKLFTIYSVAKPSSGLKTIHICIPVTFCCAPPSFTSPRTAREELEERCLLSSRVPGRMNNVNKACSLPNGPP